MRFALEPSDSLSATALYSAFVTDIAKRYPGWSPADSGSAQPAVFTPPSGAWLVGYIGSEPVACGGLQQIASDIAEVRRVFVHSDHRGEGLGRALLGALTEQARLLGYGRVCLDTGDHQPEALGLFRSVGFREVAPFNANPFAAHWLELDLA